MSNKIKGIHFYRQSIYFEQKGIAQENFLRDLESFQFIGNIIEKDEKIKNELEDINIDKLTDHLILLLDKYFTEISLFDYKAAIIPTLRVLADFIKNNGYSESVDILKGGKHNECYSSPFYSFFFDDEKQIIAISFNMFLHPMIDRMMHYSMQDLSSFDNWIDGFHSESIKYKQVSNRTTILENFIQKEMKSPVKKLKKEAVITMEHEY